MSFIYDSNLNALGAGKLISLTYGWAAQNSVKKPRIGMGESKNWPIKAIVLRIKLLTYYFSIG